MSDKVYTVQDYKSGQPRWCPGCGDHAFLNSLHKAMAELGVAPHNIAVISTLFTDVPLLLQQEQK